MTTRTYPYQAWVLKPSFKPVEVTIVGGYALSPRYDKVYGGKAYSLEELYPTKATAIEAGHSQLEKQQADLDKKQANIHKRRAALQKAMP